MSLCFPGDTLTAARSLVKRKLVELPPSDTVMDNLLLDGDKDTETTQDSHVKCRFTEDVTGIMAGGECKHLPNAKMENQDMDSLGQLFEHCIQQVSHLELRRDELIKELLCLQEPMIRVVEHLRAKLLEAQRRATLAQLDYVSVHEDMQQLKRRLFATARDSIQSQVTLAQQEYQVAQSAVTMEELGAHVLSLAQELSQLQEGHQKQLKSFRDQASGSYRPRALSDVSLCRQASLVLQRRLSGSMRTLEGWYEPRLLVLLKRRQAGENALRMSREQVTALKARLGPLRDNVQRLEVQRSCLEQRISFTEAEHEENVTQLKETVERLTETLRKLQVEFEIQRQYTKDLKDNNDKLSQELTSLRVCDETSVEEHQENSSSCGSC